MLDINFLKNLKIISNILKMFYRRKYFKNMFFHDKKIN